MPKPFKLNSTRPLPADADLVDKGGRPHIRMKERGRTVFYPLTKDGRNYLRPSRCWYYKYRDSNGIIRRVKGCTDLRATEQMAAEKERRVSRQRAGLIDPAEEHARRPLTEHLADYEAHLHGKGDTAGHVQKTSALLAALLRGCGFVFPPDVDSVKVSHWLNGQRKGNTPIPIPAGESFSPKDAAALLGISTTSVAASVKRRGLAATGNGPARRLPRVTVEALAAARCKGIGPQQVNHYIRAAKGFTHWMTRTRRMGSNPLDLLELVDTAADVRHARRELTEAELHRLFTATRASGRTFRGLAGEDRHLLYLTAAATGFRVSALANLTPEHFDLDARAVTLPVRFDKSRRGKVQPLPADVADALRDYLAGKPAGVPVWGGTWPERAADMIREDLTAAGIAYVVDGVNGPEHADFHSLRHSFLTLVSRTTDLRTAQTLAGHSSPVLTARYAHRRDADRRHAVNRLNLMGSAATAPNPNPEQPPLRLTGTEST